MADSGGKGNENSNYYRNNSRSKDDGNSDEDHTQGASVGPDIGLGNNGHHVRKSGTETGLAGSSLSGDPPRREENPFSFKHFLNRDTSGGARPKVYPSKSPSTPRLIANPELTSGLPDFVQDHLVIEQCYLNQPSQHLSVDMNNLAEFGLEATNDSWNPGRTGDLPFDLTATRHERTEPSPLLPLDLPEGLPFDLPSKPAGGEVGASTSLPDFLSDGPIHSGRRTDSGQPPSEPSSPVVNPQLSHIQSLQIENERLRRDQETLRRQLSDQIRRNESMESELRLLRSRDHEDTASLENMVRQVENNLSRAVNRAESAEMKVAKLKQEVKLLTLEVSELRVSGACGPSADRSSDHRLASELRAAVTSAEHSLRQMLSGVDTLRMIASTLENRHCFEEPQEFSEPENQDDSGPAL